MDDKEIEGFEKVRKIIRKVRQIPCTKCNYCAEVCPSDIPVSELFSVYNSLRGEQLSRDKAKEQLMLNMEKLSLCIKCGKCESNCPQNIKIRENLEKIEKIIKA